jgi:hypothetical protein
MHSGPVRYSADGYVRVAVPLVRPAWVGAALRWVRPSPGLSRRRRVAGRGCSARRRGAGSGRRTRRQGVPGHPGRTAAFPARFCGTRSPGSRVRSPRTYSRCRPASFLVISPRRTAWHGSGSTRGAQQRRGQDLMAAADHGPVLGQADGGVRAGHVPGQGRSVPFSCRAWRAPATGYGNARARSPAGDRRPAGRR